MYSKLVLSHLNLNYNISFKHSEELIHYLSFNSSLNDVIGGTHLFDGSNAVLTTDRLKNSLATMKGIISSLKEFVFMVSILQFWVGLNL